MDSSIQSFPVRTSRWRQPCNQSISNTRPLQLPVHATSTERSEVSRRDVCLIGTRPQVPVFMDMMVTPAKRCTHRIRDQLGYDRTRGSANAHSVWRWRTTSRSIRSGMRRPTADKPGGTRRQLTQNRSKITRQTRRPRRYNEPYPLCWIILCYQADRTVVTDQRKGRAAKTFT